MDSPFSKDAKTIMENGDYCILTHELLNIGSILATVSASEAGAIASFVGQTRNNFDGKVVTHLEYQAYSDLAIKTMSSIVTEARARSAAPLSRIANSSQRLLHRLGSCPVGETSVVVAVSSPHRKEAFEACSWIVDEVKRRAQIFKREYYEGYSDEQAVWKGS